MCDDPSQSAVLLFGGTDQTASGAKKPGITLQVQGGDLGDTWTWNGSNWTEQHPATAPSPRSRVGLVYDAARQQVVLFGGIAGKPTGGTLLNQTWTWDGSNWTQQHPVVTPPAEASPLLAYDAAEKVVVLFSRVSGQTWAWNGSNWTRQTPSTSPSLGSWIGLAYDGAHHVVVLVGGGGGNTLLNQTWTWNGTTWTQQHPPSSPSASSQGQLIADTAQQQLILIDPFQNQAWSWNGTTWQSLSTASVPPARVDASLAYDARRNTLILFGGRIGPQLHNDTWTWPG